MTYKVEQRLISKLESLVDTTLGSEEAALSEYKHQIPIFFRRNLESSTKLRTYLA